VVHRLCLKRQRGKADGVQGPAGSRPGRDQARVQDTTGVRERGMHAEGCLGNWGEPMVSLENIRGRSADRCGQDSRRWEEARPSQASLAGARDTQRDERYKVSGEAREN